MPKPKETQAQRTARYLRELSDAGILPFQHAKAEGENIIALSTNVIRLDRNAGDVEVGDVVSQDLRIDSYERLDQMRLQMQRLGFLKSGQEKSLFYEDQGTIANQQNLASMGQLGLVGGRYDKAKLVVFLDALDVKNIADEVHKIREEKRSKMAIAAVEQGRGPGEEKYLFYLAQALFANKSGMGAFEDALKLLPPQQFAEFFVAMQGVMQGDPNKALEVRAALQAEGKKGKIGWIDATSAKPGKGQAAGGGVGSDSP